MAVNLAILGKIQLNLLKKLNLFINIVILLN